MYEWQKTCMIALESIARSMIEISKTQKSILQELKNMNNLKQIDMKGDPEDLVDYEQYKTDDFTRKLTASGIHKTRAEWIEEVGVESFIRRCKLGLLVKSKTK